MTSNNSCSKHGEGAGYMRYLQYIMGLWTTVRDNFKKVFVLYLIYTCVYVRIQCLCTVEGSLVCTLETSVCHSQQCFLFTFVKPEMI